MTKYTLTIQAEHLLTIQKKLIQNDKKERVAYILLGKALIDSDPWNGTKEIRFLSREVFFPPDSEILFSSPSRVTWKTDSFIRVLKHAEEKSFSVAIIHNHPDGCLEFSSIDNKNELTLFRLAHNRNGALPNISIIISSDGGIIGRVWDENLKCKKIDLIRSVGTSFNFFSKERTDSVEDEVFCRQYLAFGKPFTDRVRKLRVGIVGLGATGSAVATLLTRLGIGKILLVDKDVIEKSNLNRVHFSRMIDVKKKRLKVDIIKKAILDIGIGTDVATVHEWAHSLKSINALKSCDIIFGCTDDHHGRSVLNRLAYFYLIPVIDIGLSINLLDQKKLEMGALDGHMTVILPGNTCLLCRNIINPERIRSESIKKNDPNLYSELKQEAYVIGEGNPSPAVVTFTTEIATVAVNEFIQRLQGFKGPDGFHNNIRRKFNLDVDLYPGEKPIKDCPICNEKRYWGRGDMNPYLDLVN